MSELITKNAFYDELSQEKLVNDLMNIGLTKNEAKTYLALLPSEMTTAGELVKLTGIADSKIYYLLDSLQKKGLIVLQEGIPKKFVAISPVEALENLRVKFNKEYNTKISQLDRLGKILTPIYKDNENSPKIAYILKGKHNVINQAKRLIDEATSSIIIMAPNLEIFYLLEKSIKTIQERIRDVTLGLFHRNLPKEQVPFQFQAINCECFFVIVDDHFLLTVSNWKTEHWYAIWTTEKSLIEVSSGFFTSPCCTYEKCT